MKIGIFGGSFNPPHIMHKKLVEELIKEGYVDKVIFVPTGMKYEYKNNLISNEDRFHMIQLLIKDNNSLEVSDYEFTEEVTYTYQTLDYYQNKYKEDKIYFICGTDNLSYIDKWKRGEYILENYPLLIIKRNTDEISPLLEKYKKYKDNIIVTNIHPVDLSSTDIRKLIKEDNKQELEKVLTKEVLDYIEEHNLYKESI
jgi:nicotinate-nucleotide adenylyltransferase